MHTTHRLTPIVFLAPAVVALFAVGIYPLLFALWVSLHTYILTRPYEGNDFVGLANFLSVLRDPLFWGAMGHTLVYLAISLPLQIVFGLLIALVISRGAWPTLRAATRVALVVPLAVTPVVVGLIGRLIFNQGFGVVNFTLVSLGGRDTDWLGSPLLAFATILIMEVWQWTPFVALIFLAGLTSVPQEVEEAARLETSRWSVVLRFIQLPYLLPGLTAILILRTADILKQFDMVYTLTRGGPGTSTELINLYITRVGFRVFDLGTASAQAILLLVVTVVLSRLYVRFFYREVST